MRINARLLLLSIGALASGAALHALLTPRLASAQSGSNPESRATLSFVKLSDVYNGAKAPANCTRVSMQLATITRPGGPVEGVVLLCERQ